MYPSRFWNLRSVYAGIHSGDVLAFDLTVCADKERAMYVYTYTCQYQFMYLYRHLYTHNRIRMHMVRHRLTYSRSTSTFADTHTHMYDSRHTLRHGYLPGPDVDVVIRSDVDTMDTVGTCVPREVHLQLSTGNLWVKVWDFGIGNCRQMSGWQAHMHTYMCIWLDMYCTD